MAKKIRPRLLSMDLLSETPVAPNPIDDARNQFDVPATEEWAEADSHEVELQRALDEANALLSSLSEQFSVSELNLAHARQELATAQEHVTLLTSEITLMSNQALLLKSTITAQVNPLKEQLQQQAVELENLTQAKLAADVIIAEHVAHQERLLSCHLYQVMTSMDNNKADKVLVLAPDAAQAVHASGTEIGNIANVTLVTLKVRTI